MERSKVLGNLPKPLRDELFDAFNTISKNYREERWEPAELNGGKICEIIYTILRGYIDNNYPERACKPANMVDDCRILERETKVSRSIRIQIPRLLIALYDVRNNRGVGHTGGEVNPNHMDATLIFYSAKWLLAELIRIFHNLDTDQATKAVEIIIEREIPLIWSINGTKRVLCPDMSFKEQTLVLLYHSNCSSVANLFMWIEHSNISNYRRYVIMPGHKKRIWEYDTTNKTVTLSPEGIRLAETVIASN